MTNKLQSTFSFSTALGHSVHHTFIILVKWLTSWGSQPTGWFPVLKAQTHSDRLRILNSLFFLKTLSQLWCLLSVCLCLPVPSCLSPSISYILHIHTQIHIRIKPQPWTLTKAEPQSLSKFSFSLPLSHPMTSQCGPEACCGCSKTCEEWSCSLKFSDGFCWSAYCSDNKIHKGQTRDIGSGQENACGGCHSNTGPG